MPDITLPDSVVVGEPVKASDFNTLKDAINEINNAVNLSGTQGIVGGSFESDNEVTGEPDGWDVTNNGDGTHSLETTVISHGSQALKMTATNAGGSVEGIVNEFVLVGGEEDTVFVIGSVRQDANTLSKIEVLFYDESESLISTVVAMNETALPSLDAWHVIRGHATVPSTARFYKVRLTAGDGTVDAVTYWDGMETSIKPFDWVWDFETLASGTTHTIISVGYPKYALMEGVADGIDVKGWDGSVFTTDLAWRLGVDAEISLDATGRFQTSAAATPEIKAYK